MKKKKRATIRIQPEKPVFFLFVFVEVNQACRPFKAIDIFEFFEKNVECGLFFRLELEKL